MCLSVHNLLTRGHLTQANLQRIVDTDGSGRHSKTGVHADEHILVQSVCDTCGRTSGSQMSVMTIDQSPSSRGLHLVARKDLAKAKEAVEHEAQQKEETPDPLMDVTLFIARERLKELEMREEQCEVKWDAPPRDDMLRHEITSLRRR
jgi:hypothetical protein